jgi:peptide/nickel transport system substrate-binding protein
LSKLRPAVVSAAGVAASRGNARSTGRHVSLSRRWIECWLVAWNVTGERWKEDDVNELRTANRPGPAWADGRITRRRLGQLVAGGAGASLLATATPRLRHAAGQEAGGEVSIHWRNTAQATLTPLFNTAGNNQTVERLVFGALVNMNDKMVPVPDLAETVESSPDATSYTFRLGQGYTFTDGQPLTSADVAFTLERAINVRTGSYWGGRLGHIAGSAAYNEGTADHISGIETPDDLTIVLTLERPDAAFLVTLANFSGLGILPQHILGDVAPEDLEQHPFWTNPDVTAGAFRFARYETDQFMELVRNDSYGGDLPALDRIFLRILTPEVAIAELELGEIDAMTVPVSEVERVRTFPDVNVVSVPSPSIALYAVNLELDYLQDKRIRQAMLYAIDRQSILDEIYLGEGHIINSPIFGPDWIGTPDGLVPYEYNPDRARQLLQEAGWDSSRTVEILYGPVDQEKDISAAVIQEQWREVGLESELLKLDWAEVGRRYINDHEYEVNYGGGGTFRADPSVSATFFHSENWTPRGGNGSHYANPELDDLFDQGVATCDLEERKQIYTRAAQILNDELPWLFLWSPNSIHAVSNRLIGYAPPSYADNKLWNAETWTVNE